MKSYPRVFSAIIFSCLTCFLIAPTLTVSAQNTGGEVDPALNSAIDAAPGNVEAALVQPDGKVIVGGYFKTLNGVRRRGIARLNVDNSIDPTFAADINGIIFDIALQPNGKIVIAGDFTAVNGVNRNRIAVLNADGSLDAAFNPGNGADQTVYDVAVQPDGKILLGGGFYGVNSTAAYLIARLNADGSSDASFKSPFAPSFFGSPNPPQRVVYSLALQSNGRIVLGGTPGFTSGDGSTFSITAIARLNADGTIDSLFKAAGIGGTVEKVVVQPDDKILIGGSFSSVEGASRRFIARLNADGSLDASFNPGTGGNLPIHSIFLKPDGKILIGGDFSTFNGSQRNRIAQLNADGSLDTTFVPASAFIGTAQSVVALPSGKILVLSSLFRAFNSAGGDSIAIFNSDGSRDSSAVFTTTATGGVRAIATQADGKIIAGGNFNRVNGLQRDYTARFETSGALIAEGSDSGFSSFSGSGGQVNSIVVQPDGKTLIAGVALVRRTSSGNGISVFIGGSIMRLNVDGSHDDSFVPGNIPARNGINAMALQPDGKIVVVWGYAFQNGFPTGGAARLNADGSLDTTFSYRLPELFLNSVVVQPDGKILLGGEFSFGVADSRTGNVSYNGVVRLNQDGSRDATFTPATISENGRFTKVYALALAPDGKILIGGSLFTGARAGATGAARLNSNGSLDAAFDANAIFGVSADTARVEDVLPLPNGQILIGGLFNKIGTTARNNIARLNADGLLDTSFNASADNVVYALALQRDGKILIGGDFETVGSVPRTSIARLLNNPATRRAVFDSDGDGRADLSVFRPSNGTWYSVGSRSGFTLTQFGVAADIPVAGDYDGDGKTDIAVFRPSDGKWYILTSAGYTVTQFGADGDVPAAADYDGDGRTDIAVFRPSNGTWYLLTSAGYTVIQFGAAGDIPVAADYDGDGKSDLAVFRPSNGRWYLLTSAGYTVTQFGESGDVPVSGDYNGDGKSDIAVFRPSNGTWYFLTSAGFSLINFGANGDIPVAADYDGDGKTDIAVFRPSNGNWYLVTSAGFTIINFGIGGDVPVASRIGFR